MTLVTLILVLMGFFFKDDHRWKDKDPKLGWCFYVCLVTGILTLITGLVMLRLLQHDRQTARSKVHALAKLPPKQNLLQQKKRNQLPPLPPQPPKDKPGDGSQSQDKAVTPVTLSLIKKVEEKKVGEDKVEEKAEGEKMEELPPPPSYDIAAEPGSELPQGPRDYHVSMEDGGAATPQLTVPAGSSWRSSAVFRSSWRFLTSYGKAAVGKKTGD